MIKNLKSVVSVLDSFQIFGRKNIQIKGIEADSRKIKKGYLFVAIKGATFDGHDFIPQAVKAKAAGVVGEKDFEKIGVKDITYIKVSNSRKALSLLAAAWYGFPAKKLRIVGVTGTDGKTTTANLIGWILKTTGKKVGLVSTLNAKIGGQEIDTGLHVTNPEPLLLQELLAKMVKAKCEYAVLEVTSHGLDQERVAGIDFEVGVLTNITHEHLDYHKTFAKYLKAKSRLFNTSKIAILNKNDTSFNKISKLVPKNVQVVTYDLKNFKGRLKIIVKKRFPEKFNWSNALAAITCAKILGVNEASLSDVIAKFPQLAGRMEEVKNNKGVKILIDFAHTPNSLENVLKVLKEKKPRKLIAIYGCAGERDREKRSLMGEISGRLADVSVFTAEDPRGEKVEAIIDQMVGGAKKSKAREVNIKKCRSLVHGTKNQKQPRHFYVSIPERGEAIAFAIQKLARKGDTIVICGKGHEKSMAYGTVEYPWSEQQAVKVALAGGVKRSKDEY